MWTTSTSPGNGWPSTGADQRFLPEYEPICPLRRLYRPVRIWPRRQSGEWIRGLPGLEWRLNEDRRHPPGLGAMPRIPVDMPDSQKEFAELWPAEAGALSA